MEDPYEAYCLDEAIWFLGSWIEGELSEVTVKNNDPKKLQARKQAKLKYLLTGNKAAMYADPARKAKG